MTNRQIARELSDLARQKRQQASELPPDMDIKAARRLRDEADLLEKAAKRLIELDDTH